MTMAAETESYAVRAGRKMAIENGRAGFVFIALDGQRKIRDGPTRKAIRTHVMKDFLESSQQPLARKRSPQIEEGARGQKMRFRLKADGLEPSLPYRRGKKATQAARSKETIFVPAKVAMNEGPVAMDIRISDFQRPYDASESVPVKEEVHRMDGQLAQFGTLSSRPGTTPFQRPAQTMPFVLDQVDEILLERFQNFVHESWCPVSGQSSWLSFARNDPVLLHATIYNWAAHWLEKDSSVLFRSPRIIHHGAMAVKLINRRLATKGKLSDEMVGAVAAMTTIEIAFGRPQQAFRSFAGLVKMVKMRGGIHTLADGIDGLLKRLVTWVDLTHAQLFNVPLAFSKQHDMNMSFERSGSRDSVEYNISTDTFMDSKTSSPSSTSSLDILPFPLSPSHPISPTRIDISQPSLASHRSWLSYLSPTVQSILTCVFCIRTTIDTIPYSQLSNLESMYRSDKIIQVERRLTLSHHHYNSRKHASHSPSPSSSSPESDPTTQLQDEIDIVSSVTCVACLLYMQTSLRLLPVAYQQLGSLANQLRVQLSSTWGDYGDLMVAWTAVPELLTWMLAVGASISLARQRAAKSDGGSALFSAMSSSATMSSAIDGAAAIPTAATFDPSGPGLSDQGNSEWFLTHLAMACRGLEVRDWTSFTDTMRGIVWSETQDPRRFESVWREVAEQLDFPSGPSPRAQMGTAVDLDLHLDLDLASKPNWAYHAVGIGPDLSEDGFDAGAGAGAGLGVFPAGSHVEQVVRDRASERAWA